MEVVAVVISLGALAVALGGYFLNRRELHLLETQVETQVAAHQASGSAVVTAQPGSISWGNEQSAYEVTFINGGPATAKGVDYRVIDQDEYTVADGDVAPMMLKGDRVKIAVHIPRKEYKRLFLLVGWNDQTRHEEAVCELQVQP